MTDGLIAPHGGELRENMAKDRLQQPEFDKTLIPVR